MYVHLLHFHMVIALEKMAVYFFHEDDAKLALLKEPARVKFTRKLSGRNDREIHALLAASFGRETRKKLVGSA